MKDPYDIDTVDLVGHPYEIGGNFGRALAADRRRLSKFQAFVRSENNQIKALPTYAQSEVNNVLSLLERESPAILEWLEGMVVELGLSSRELLLFSVGSYFRDLMLGLDSHSHERTNQRGERCSTFAVSESEQGPLLAKNRDCSSAYGPWQVMIRVRPGRGLGYMAVTTYGVAGVNSSGMNEQGLVVADTHVTSLDIGCGLPRFALMDKILNQCAAVSEALGLIGRQPLMGRGNLILIDASGALGVAELGHRACAVRRSTAGHMVNTNHFSDPLLQNAFLDPHPAPLKGTSQARYSRLATLVAAGCRNLEEAQRIMTYHGTPLDSLCRHEEWDPPYRTISTVFYLPLQRRAVVSYSYPCIANYQEVIWG